jgi:ABC-2 type transport system ATP-binding protein
MDAVRFEHVSRRYGNRLALDGVELVVPAGSLFGLIGPNGAGKSTCISLIATLLPPSSGRVHVFAADVSERADEARRRIGYAPEEPLVYGGLTPREFVELSATLHGLDAAAGRRAAAELLTALGLGDRADDAIAGFSKGMRRKALLAAALAHDPDLLVLDEPLEGLDVFAQQALKALLRARVARGKTVLYSTHILEVVDGLCSHVALLARGKLVADGTLDGVKARLGVANLVDAFTPARIDA